MRLAGKVALLAGCGPNINAGIAYGLAAEGAKIVCADLHLEYSQACAREISERGGEAVGVRCDVTRESDVEAAIEQAYSVFGSVDILINGVARQIRKGLLDVSLEEFQQQIRVSLDGTFLFTQHTARRMIGCKTRGSIINIGSTESHQGNIGNIAYGTAKSGLLNFTRCAAMELAEFGIRVNTLSPTGTDPKEGLERAKSWGVKWEEGLKAPPRNDVTFGDQGIPLGRRPTPHDYAKAAVFLASDDSEMITGFDLRVDGGVVARYWRWNPGARIVAAAIEP